MNQLLAETALAPGEGRREDKKEEGREVGILVL